MFTITNVFTCLIPLWVGGVMHMSCIKTSGTNLRLSSQGMIGMWTDKIGCGLPRPIAAYWDGFADSLLVHSPQPMGVLHVQRGVWVVSGCESDGVLLWEVPQLTIVDAALLRL
jgi:hypothetical protein